MISNGHSKRQGGGAFVTVRSTSATGELSVARLPDSGIIEVNGHGLWTVEQVRDHFDRYTGAVIGVRATGQPIRVIVDLRSASVQPPEVAAMIETGAAGLYRDGDRCAMIVRSKLMHIQLRRILDPVFHEVFMDRSAATDWLLGTARKSAA